MTAGCPNCGDSLGFEGAWRSFSWSRTDRGRTRCESCAAHLVATPASVVATILATTLAILAMAPLWGSAFRIGGIALTTAAGVVASLVLFVAAYVLLVRFRVQEGSSIFTESLLKEL